MSRIDWDSLHMTIAAFMAMRSPDPSSQTGAVIAAQDNTIVATGYNGWPRGIAPFADDDPRWKRPDKYHWMAHAERNAIDNAARTGAPLNGCTLYTLLMPCVDCARGIIQVGIRKVVVSTKYMDAFRKHLVSTQSWVDGLRVTNDMFKEAGVELVLHQEPFATLSLTVSGYPYSHEAPQGILKAIGPVLAGKVSVDECSE